MIRILLLSAALAMTIASNEAFAQSRKGNPLCPMDGCLAHCAKVGGQPRLCPVYCEKRIAERKAAGQC